MTPPDPKLEACWLRLVARGLSGNLCCSTCQSAKDISCQLMPTNGGSLSRKISGSHRRRGRMYCSMYCSSPAATSYSFRQGQWKPAYYCQTRGSQIILWPLRWPHHLQAQYAPSQVSNKLTTLQNPPPVHNYMIL